MIKAESIDLHIHTTASDGTDTPEELLARVRGARLSLFAVTDHDSVKSSAAIRAMLLPGDPLFITGAEFSCRDAEGKYHILGYGFDPEAEPIVSLTEAAHAIRMTKITRRLDTLRTRFGVKFPPEEIRALLSMTNPGKPHIANLMVKYGYASDRDEALRSILNRIRPRVKPISPEQAIAAILAGGGLPVLAHPFFGDGGQRIEGKNMERRLARLVGFGLRGVEAFYSGFSPEQSKEMLGYADRFGLAATAGSDYHGANKAISLGSTGLRGEELPPAVQRFLCAMGIENT